MKKILFYFLVYSNKNVDSCTSSVVTKQIKNLVLDWLLIRDRASDKNLIIRVWGKAVFLDRLRLPIWSENLPYMREGRLFEDVKSHCDNV